MLWLRSGSGRPSSISRSWFASWQKIPFAIHARQAAEKYLKAPLTKRQLEFPKTHEIRRLLELLNASDHEVSEALADAKWLDPFGVGIRYPGDRPETRPGDERCALQLPERTRAVVTKALAL